MAKPTFQLGNSTFTFSNGHITIEAQTEIAPPNSITVGQVTFKTPAPALHDTFTLPLHDFVVPIPVAEHLFDLLI